MRKVDTHIHLAAAMDKKQLLRFSRPLPPFSLPQETDNPLLLAPDCRHDCRRKIAERGNDVVDQSCCRILRAGSVLTLQQVCQQINLNPANLSIDSLGCHADSSTYHRFDRFNDKYNPFGQSLLREVFSCYHFYYVISCDESGLLVCNCSGGAYEDW